MDPDESFALARLVRVDFLREYSRRDSSHSFRKSAAVFAMAQHLENPVGEAQEHSRREQQAVEKVGQAQPF